MPAGQARRALLIEICMPLFPSGMHACTHGPDKDRPSQPIHARINVLRRAGS
jgi:hypothetical protein